MVVVAVLTSLTSSYLSWCSGQASSSILLTAGASLAVSLQWAELGAVISLASVTALSYLSQRDGAQFRGSLVFLPSHQVTHPDQAQASLPELSIYQFMKEKGGGDEAQSSVFLFLARE